MTAGTASVRRRRWPRRLAVGLAAVLALALGAVALGWGLAQWRMQRHVTVDVGPLVFDDVADEAVRARGGYLYASRGCADCHGRDGAGRVFIDDPDSGMRVVGPQIARGDHTVTDGWQAGDWVRAIRHGVGPDGRPILIMPSEDYNRLTDADVAAIVAHVRSLPARPGLAGRVELPLPVRVLYGYGMIRDAAAKIDHGRPPSVPVPEGDTIAHGEYVAQACIGCHGPRLEGGRIPGGPPHWPPASRLVAGEGSVMGRYPDAASLQAMFASGRRPDGSAVDVMPFEALREMSAVDVRALHRYLTRAAR